MPERCTFPVPLNCQDYVVLNDAVKIVLLNDGGRSIIIKDITATSEAFRPIDNGNLNHNCSLVVSERDKLLKNGEEKMYTLNVSTETGKKCLYHDVGKSKNRYFIEVESSYENDTRNFAIKGELFSASPEGFSSRPANKTNYRGNLIFSDYGPFLFLALTLILFVATSVCYVKKKRGLTLVLMALFVMVLFVAALWWLGFFGPTWSFFGPTVMTLAETGTGKSALAFA